MDHAVPLHPVTSTDTCSPADDPAIAALLDSIPITAQHPCTVVDLPGGLTNRNLKVTTPSATVVVRIPGPGSERLGIDHRHAEHSNSVGAAQAGVGPPVVHHRPGQGSTALRHPELVLGERAVATFDGPELETLLDVAGGGR